jgi:hypothetical protein
VVPAQLKETLPMRGARSLLRWFYRHRPGVILALFVVAVGAPLVLDFLTVWWVHRVHDWLDELAKGHEVGVDLLDHVLVAALVAAAAIFWVLGHKRQKALKSYRACAREKPWELVEWSRGEAPSVRGDMCEILADEIRRSPKAEVAVVQGRAGSGRTSFVVGLVRELAKLGLVPIPVLAKRDGSFALDALARETFCRHVDEVLSSDEQADAIWRRARAARSLVVLVDGLDDEVVTMLRRDDGLRFQQTIRSLLDDRIAVVLATTSELPFGEIKPLREDLDSFSREEATSYLEAALEDAEQRADAITALKRLDDPVEDSVAPFYLDLIVRLEDKGTKLHGLPEHKDRWRAAILQAYLDAVECGDVVPGGSDGDGRELVGRGQKAKRAAEAVARMLPLARADLTLARRWLRIEDQVLGDANELQLLSCGAERVAFASDDLAAYLVAATQDDPSRLLKSVCRNGEDEGGSKRRDRLMRTALIFWHLQHESKRVETFDRLLTDLKGRPMPPPAVFAAAVRIVSACGLEKRNRRVAKAVRACIKSLNAADEPDARSQQAAELLGLVRALAGWRNRRAHNLLWRLATNHKIEVEWPAAKALAMVDGEPKSPLWRKVAGVLETARKLDPGEMAAPAHDIGNKVGSLAWILPSLRGASDAAEKQLGHVKSLCLDKRMSPLRGEMSLAQGLKLAIMNERVLDRNVADVRELLFERNGGLRFWHARLVLVQAMLAHAWKHRDDAAELKKRLDALRSKEPHLLVKHGIDLARRGLRELEQSPRESYLLVDHGIDLVRRGLRELLHSPKELEQSPNGDDRARGRYMWDHEREAVRWVGLGKAEVTQLAADVVLLSNMAYRLRTQVGREADAAATHEDLPRCIRKSSNRQNIKDGCECARGLCRNPYPPAVLATRARFSDSFCREQARLVARLGPPSWTKRRIPGAQHREHLEQFWKGQAEVIAEAREGQARTGS